MDQTKINTLFKAETRKMTPYAREEQSSLNGSTLFRFCVIPGRQHQAYYGRLKINFNRSFVFCLTGCLRTAILADTI